MSILKEIDLVLEDSYSGSDIPDHFYLVFTLLSSPKSRPVARSLREGQFSGLKGISASNQIVLKRVPSGGDSILKMNGHKVIEENELSRIIYDNPHYLLSSDMKALRRIFDTGSIGYEKGRVWIIKRVLDLFYDAHVGAKPTNTTRLADHVVSNIQMYGQAIGSSELNSVRDFAKRWKKVNDEQLDPLIGVSSSELQELVKKYTIEAVDQYRGESEWVVKDDTFNIPEGSTLMVGSPSFTHEENEIYESFLIKVNDVGLDSALSVLDIGNELLLKISKRYELHSKIENYRLGDRYTIRSIDPSKLLRISRGLGITA